MAKTLQTQNSQTLQHPFIPNIKTSGLAGLVYALNRMLEQHSDVLTEADVKLLQSTIQATSGEFSYAACALKLVNKNPSLDPIDGNFAWQALEATAAIIEAQDEMMQILELLDYRLAELRKAG